MQYQKLVNTLIEIANQDFPKRNFHLAQLLGSGGEGGAFLATASEWGNNPKQVVIKIQEKMKENEKSFLINLIQYQNLYENGYNEIFIPSHIIKIYELFEWQQYHCVIMEVGKENLFEFMTNNKNLPMNQKLQICYQICNPICLLHNSKLIHRDIKPENYIKVGNIFKLIDFGLVRSSTSDNKTKYVGTALFQSPEILENSSSYTEKVDVWSLGCVFYEILSNEAMFNGNSHEEVAAMIRNHKNRPHVVFNKINALQTPQQVKDILLQMILYDEINRRSLEWVYYQFKNYFEVQFKVQPPIQVQPTIQVQPPIQGQPTFLVKHNHQIPKDYNRFEQQMKFNVLETRLKEQDNQIEIIKEGLGKLEKQEKEEKEERAKLNQEQQQNLDESKKYNLNLIETLKQQITKDNIAQQQILDEKGKQIDGKVSSSENKIQQQEERIKSLEQQIQNNQQVTLKEQQISIKKQEDNQIALKKEISEQNSQMEKVFQDQLSEIKLNFLEQLHQLNQKLQHQTESQVKYEQENQNKILELKTSIDQLEEYKNTVQQSNKQEGQSSTSQNIQNTNSDLQNSLESYIEQIENLKSQQIEDKINILEQIKQYTSKMFQDLIKQISNQGSENEHSINNYQSNQYQSQDQQSLNQNCTQSQDSLNDQQLNSKEENIKNNELSNNETSGNNRSQNLQILEEYENNFVNLRTDFLKQLHQHNNQRTNQINLLNKDIVDLKNQMQDLLQEKEQFIKNRTQLENSNKDLANQLKESQLKFEQVIQNSIKEDSSLKSQSENLKKNTQEEKSNLELQQQIQSLQNELMQAHIPVNQILELTEFFKNQNNLMEFSDKYGQEFAGLLALINNQY